MKTTTIYRGTQDIHQSLRSRLHLQNHLHLHRQTVTCRHCIERPRRTRRHRLGGLWLFSQRLSRECSTWKGPRQNPNVDVAVNQDIGKVNARLRPAHFADNLDMEVGTRSVQERRCHHCRRHHHLHQSHRVQTVRVLHLDQWPFTVVDHVDFFQE